MAKKGSKFNKYSYEFKVMVVLDYLSGKSGGLLTIVKKYELKSHTQIKDWVKKYREKPKLLSIETRRDPGRPKSIKMEEMSLEQQNEYLRMENDILKKLKALQEKYGEQ